MAATLALVGAGVAAAALARRRSSAPEPEQPRRAKGKPRRPKGKPRRSKGKTRRSKEKPRRTKGKTRRPKLQRRTLAQLEQAIALMQGRDTQPADETVHEARKALKRARALVRLQRKALGEKRFAHLDRTLREAGRRLAGARDAEVMVEALDGLIAQRPKRLGESAAVGALRAELVRERERLREQTRQGAPARAAIVAECSDARRIIAQFQAPAQDGRAVRAGLRRIYRAGRRRRRRARRRQTSAALHDWRKRVKDLRYAAEALELRGATAKRADRLGETLGSEHDLMLLYAQVRRRRKLFAHERKTYRLLRKRIRRRRRRLRKQAWRLGDELYARKPKRFVRRALH